MKMCVFKVSVTFFFPNLFNSPYECPPEPVHTVCVIADVFISPGYLACGHTFCICVPTSVSEYFFLCHCS